MGLPFDVRKFFQNIQKIKKGLRLSSVNFVVGFPPGGQPWNMAYNKKAGGVSVG